MRIRIVILNLLMIETRASTGRNFIFDYFVYKNAPRVVGFTCNDVKENIALVKNFGEVGIAASFGHVYNESLLYQLIGTDHYKLGIYIDLSCDNTTITSTILSLATAERLYDELHYWLVVLPYYDNATDLIDDDTFNLATDLVVAVPSFYYTGYELYDLYNPYKARGGKLNVTFLGLWNETDGLAVSLSQSKYDRRANLHGMYWKVAFFGIKYRPNDVPLEDHFKDFERTGTKDGLSKFGFNMIMHVAEMYNVSMLLREYTKWRKDDRIGPLTKALQYGEIDMTGTPISVNTDKLRRLKFVYTAWPFRTCFIFRTPPITDIKVREVLHPFEDSVWYSTCVMLALFISIMILTFRYENIDSFLIQFSNSFLITIGCICQQGTNEPINNISTRMAFLHIMIFSFLIYNYYSASVVSDRLNEPILKINDSLDRLAMTNLEVASEPMIYFDFFMQQNPTETNLFNQKKWIPIPENNRFIPPEKGMSLVRGGGWAYHTHPEVGYPFINRFYDNREICELSEVHLAKPTYRSIAVTYNSSFTEISKRGFIRLNEVGIRQRQYSRFSSRKPNCRRDVLNVSSTGIYEFAAHLIVLMIGMTLSIVLCAIEIIANRLTWRKRNKQEIAATYNSREHDGQIADDTVAPIGKIDIPV